jgi:hypothetical protein
MMVFILNIALQCLLMNYDKKGFFKTLNPEPRGKYNLTI